LFGKKVNHQVEGLACRIGAGGKSTDQLNIAKRSDLRFSGEMSQRIDTQPFEKMTEYQISCLLDLGTLCH